MAGQAKEKTLTLRITEAMYDKLEEVHEILESERDPYLSKVTKTETLTMLLKLGIDEFERKRKPRG